MDDERTELPDDDLVAPSIGLTLPLPGDSLSANPRLSAEPEDDVGIEKVTFFVDGTAVGEVLASPYDLDIDPSALAPGRHQVSAVATDLAGNTTETAAVEVFVDATDLGATVSCSTLASGASLVVGVLADDCAIEGDLRLGEESVLTVVDARLEVHGDIVLSESAFLRIDGGTLRIANDYTLQRSIQASDQSVLLLDHAVLETTGVPGTNMTASWVGTEQALLRADSSSLDVFESWLLAVPMDEASIQAVASEGVPTESYIQDAATLVLRDMEKSLRVWMEVAADASASLVDPADGIWRGQYGRLEPGFEGTEWLVQVYDARLDIGLESYPRSAITIEDGDGLITLSLFFDGTTEETVIEGLPGGLPNGQGVRATGSWNWQDRALVLDQALLSPIAWQIYAQNAPMEAPVVVRDTVVNELAALKEASVLAEDVTFQFGYVWAANTSYLQVDHSILNASVIGVQASSVLVVNDSEIWGSLLMAQDSSVLVVLDSELHGNECHQACNPFLEGFCMDGEGDVCNPLNPNTSGRPQVYVVGDDATVVIAGITPFEGPIERTEGPVSIQGDAVVHREEGTTVDPYTLAIRPAGSTADPVFVVEGQAPVEGDVLGTFDPANLDPGDYEIVLQLDVASLGESFAVKTPFTIE